MAGLRLWRLGNTRFPLYSGEGPRLFGGRWNSRGVELIYASPSLAGAVLELRVHTNNPGTPIDQGYIWIDVPVGVSFEVVEEEAIDGWRDSDSVSKAFGDRWVSEKRSCLLLVPSIILESRIEPSPIQNVLINPKHAEAEQITYLDVPEPFKWDPRLFAAG